MSATTKSTYTLAEQSGNRAFFAGVALEVFLSSGQEDVVIDIDSEVDVRWHSAVLLGIEYAIEQIADEEHKTKRISVHVASVEWQPFDSTLMTVMFAAANATWAALGRRPNRTPRLDASSSSFIFPN